MANNGQQVEEGVSITYHSSKWEQLWLDNIARWQDEKLICEAIANQTTYVHAFMRDLCVAATDTPWCLIDDSVHRIWYHTVDSRVHFSLVRDEVRTPSRPLDITHVYHHARPKIPSDRRIWSWFERRDEQTGETSYEYIEPLVAHLRHPLALCGPYGKYFLVDRSYMLPGGVWAWEGRKRSGRRAPREKRWGRKRGRKGGRKQRDQRRAAKQPGSSPFPSPLSSPPDCYLFDAGASSWADGEGGPSLVYFAEYWRRFGVEWSRIEAFEGGTSPENFFQTVPLEWQPRVKFHYANVTVSRDAWPFLPSVIEESTRIDDYVVLKLDIDSSDVETAIVDYMLQWDKLNLVDEFLWEHHVTNYLMAPFWGHTQDKTRTIADSYHYFLRLRQRGIRAHSWV